MVSYTSNIWILCGIVHKQTINGTIYMTMYRTKFFTSTFPAEFLQSHSNVNTTKFHIITCILATKGVTIKGSECTYNKPKHTQKKKTTIWRKVASNMCYRSMDCEMNGHLIHAGCSQGDLFCSVLLLRRSVKYRTFNKACRWCQITDMMYSVHISHAIQCEHWADSTEPVQFKKKWSTGHLLVGACSHEFAGPVDLQGHDPRIWLP